MQADSPNFTFRQTAGEAVTARPSLLSFQCPYYINQDSWDDTEAFYDDEMQGEKELFEEMEARSDESCIPSARAAWHLQQTFVVYFLQWMPLMEVDDFVEHCQAAQSADYSADDLDNCVTMLAYAIAELAEDKDGTSGHLGHADAHPGIAFFRRGCDVLDRISPQHKRDVAVLQCRLLRAFYCELAIQPLLAWDHTSEIARDCMHILSSGSLQRMVPQARDVFLRVYWICSVLFHALEAILKNAPHRTATIP